MREPKQVRQLSAPLQRRKFLGLCGGVAAGIVLGQQGAWAVQGDGESDPLLGPMYGVSPAEVKLGMSAAFRGSSARLGIEYYRGSQAYYSDLNDRGGVNGRRISLLAFDDGCEPLPLIDNTIRLVEEEKVFFLTSYVGSPTLAHALPVIKRYASQGLLLVGNCNGGQLQREEPYTGQVFNLRASYRQEMMSLIDRFWHAGCRKFGVFYQLDAYGRSGTEGVARGLGQRGTKITAEATCHANARYGDDMSLAAAHLREAGVDVVLCTGFHQGCGAFIKACRRQGWDVPISNLSSVGSDSLLRLLLKTEREDSAGRLYTKGLVNAQVVPSYDTTSLSGVVAYREAMDQWNPDLPSGAEDSYEISRYSFASLEGYLNARVIGIALQRAGANPTRELFKQALESLDTLDLGIGATISFGPGRHQGLDTVYFNRVQDGRWVPVRDWAQVLV